MNPLHVEYCEEGERNCGTDRHPLAIIVKVNESQQLIELCIIHNRHFYLLRGTRSEREAKSPRGREESSLVRTLCLVLEGLWHYLLRLLVRFSLWQHCVAQGYNQLIVSV